MKDLLQKLRTFFRENKTVMILNTSTDIGLLCLSPSVKIEGEMVVLTFDALNEDHSHIIYLKALQGEEEKTLYVENDQDNILMLQALSLENYKQYVRKNYTNPFEFNTLEELEKEIQKEII